MRRAHPRGGGIIVSIVKTTLTLDDDVYEAAAYLARTSGKRPGAVASGLMRRGLARYFTHHRNLDRTAID